MTPVRTIQRSDAVWNSPIRITARRAQLSDAECISSLLGTGTNPAIVTPNQVRGTLQAGSYSFLLYRADELLGLIELRAIHPEPERSDAVVVIWLVNPNPVGMGVVAVGFILNHAFSVLGLREVWGWVRNDNRPMLALCHRLGFTDNGLWAGDPEFRLMTCLSIQFDEVAHRIERLNRRILIHSAADSSPVSTFL